MRKLLTSLAVAVTMTVTATSAMAAGGNTPKPEAQDWPWQGFFGSYDQQSLQRGFQVFYEVCSGCHSLRLVAYRNLMEIGFTEDQVKEIASEYEVRTGPNDVGEELDEDGEFLTRPAILADKIVPPYPNDAAAADANGGALPPDLSLMAKARMGGPDYIYGLLTGYYDELPEGEEWTKDLDISDDKYINKYFPGHAISMGPPIFEDAVEYEDGTPASEQQIARDITAFLNWAAEPELDERKSLGMKVMIFLIIFTALSYALKVLIWKDVKH